MAVKHYHLKHCKKPYYRVTEILLNTGYASIKNLSDTMKWKNLYRNIQLLIGAKEKWRKCVSSEAYEGQGITIFISLKEILAMLEREVLYMIISKQIIPEQAKWTSNEMQTQK